MIPAYVDAVCADIVQQAAKHPGRTASTVFFGGGTPSLLSPEQIGRMLDACRAALPVATDAEITLEANPNSVDAAYFAGLRAAGVNRLSLGVQTTHRRGLRVLGRMHGGRGRRLPLVKGFTETRTIAPPEGGSFQARWRGAR